MRSILLTILLSGTVLAKEVPVKALSRQEPVKIEQLSSEQPKTKRCKFSDLSCQAKNDRPVTRKLKRLSRF